MSGILLSEMSWDLIFMLIALGAVVAVVGDQIGMRFGKKRISLFGLRPRYTSRVITVVTGILITLATLAVLGSTSETVRAALFGMKYLQGQVTDLTKQLQGSRQNLETMQLEVFTSQQELEDKQQELEDKQRELEDKQKEVASVEDLLAREAGHLADTRVQLSETTERTRQLEKRRIELEEQLDSLRKEHGSLRQSVGMLREESENLKKGLQQVREGHILAFSGELLAQTSLSEKADPDEIEAALRRIRQLAEVLLQRRKKTDDSDVGIVVAVAEENLNSVRSRLGTFSGRVVLRLTALANAITGERVPCEIKIFPSKHLFQKGELLNRGTAPANLNEEDASDVLYGILREINQKAITKGVLPDPLLGTVGNLSTIDFYEAVDKITNKPQRLEVAVYAAEDVYSEGPVRVYVNVDEK